MIKIPRTIYEKFLRFSLENANPLDSRNWKESIGLILGRISEHEILITDIVPIGSGTAVFVDITDYERVFSLISVDRIQEGEVIVGWAHTHPGLGLFLSGIDIRTQQMYQQMHPKAFALVMDHTKITNEFSGFNIYRLKDYGAHPRTVEYYFDESFDFLTTRENLTSELYLVPEVPIIISESEVSWKGIRIKISGDKQIPVNQPFQVKISLFLPSSQFIHIKYQLKTHKIMENPFLEKLIDRRAIYHEMISTGPLSTFTFRSKEIGTAYLRIENLTLLNYQQKQQEMPDMCFYTQIRENY
ncbi:MAG: hypothetical protein ACFFB2_10440 [Promethearchaeota archaeon]